MEHHAGYVVIRWLFERSLACVYFVAFLVACTQILALCGSSGLLPARRFLGRVSFWDYPSIFWINCSDRALRLAAFTGLVLSGLAIVGVSDRLGYEGHGCIFFGLWLLQLSFLNIGQLFYQRFGFENLLCEVGFLAIFLGPADAEPSMVVIWLLRWTLFRVMFESGVRKLLQGPQWRNLTALSTFHLTLFPP